MGRMEQRVGLFAGIIIVFFVLYLAYRNEAFASAQLYELIRIVLSLGIGVVAATIPGFLGIEGNIAGIAIRAGGGLAAFVLTFFFSPGTLPALTPPGEVSIDGLRGVDFRTVAGPGSSEEDRKRAPLAITMSIIARSRLQPSLNNTVEKTEVHFALAGKDYVFPWKDFVQMHEENFGKWLGKIQDAVPFSVSSGEIVHYEILHTGSDILTWGDFLSQISTNRQELIDIKFVVSTDRGQIVTNCAAEMKPRYVELQEFVERAKKSPGRITTTCKQIGA